MARERNGPLGDNKCHTIHLSDVNNAWGGYIYLFMYLCIYLFIYWPLNAGFIMLCYGV